MLSSFPQGGRGVVRNLGPVKLPNVLTLSRLLLAPLFLFAFLHGERGGVGDEPYGPWLALGVAVFFEVTDLVDGFLARRLEQTSQLGKILDPLADSVSRFTIFLAFVAEGYASIWAIALIFYRDSIVSTIRILAAGQGVIVGARMSGKIKAWVQGFAISLILAANCVRPMLGWEMGEGGADPLVETLSWPLMWFVAAFTMLSLVDYLVGNRKVLAQLDR